MHAKVLTWLSIAALLSALAFSTSAPAFQLQLNLVVCVAAIAVLAALRPPPLLSVPSITDRTPGSQSL